MPRTQYADACATRPLLYCRTHEQAYVVPMAGAPHWYALPWSRLVYAQGWARAGRCTIRLHETPCPQCATTLEENADAA
jgi:hypothetical protein